MSTFSVTMTGPGTAILTPNPAETAFLIVQLALAAAEIDRYGSAYRDSVRNLRRGLELQEEVSDWYHDFYINTQALKLEAAVEYALSLEIPVSDPAKVYRRVSALVNGMIRCDEDLPQMLMGASCIDALDDCEKRFEIESNRVKVAVAHNESVGAKIDRTAEIQRKMEAIRSAIRRASAESSGIYAEINTHLGIYQSLADIASGGFNGALGNAGRAIGSLVNKYSSAQGQSDGS